MTARARELFEALRPHIRSIDPEIIELAESKSVSYHGPAFFLEVLPRKDHINLLVPLDFNEVVDASGIAEDATQWIYPP